MSHGDMTDYGYKKWPALYLTSISHWPHLCRLSSLSCNLHPVSNLRNNWQCLVNFSFFLQNFHQNHGPLCIFITFFYTFLPAYNAILASHDGFSRFSMTSFVFLFKLLDFHKVPHFNCIKYGLQQIIRKSILHCFTRQKWNKIKLLWNLSFLTLWESTRFLFLDMVPYSDLYACTGSILCLFLRNMSLSCYQVKIIILFPAFSPFY